MAPSLVGVGVGPGDPDLLTVRAVRILRDADRVFCPTIAIDAVGRAEAVVRAALPQLPLERLVFAIGADPDARAGAHRAAAARIAACLDAGERVAFVTLGDPNVYSTFHQVARTLLASRPETPVETVPGVMAFQDLAARAGVKVVEDGEQLALVCALDGVEAVEKALADPAAAVVVYKGGRHLPAIARALDAAGRLGDAVFGELLGLPGERIGPVPRGGGPAAYLSSVIVPPARP